MKEKRTRIRRKNAGYKKIFLLLIIVFILMLIITKIIFPATISLSRYVYSVVKGVYLNSKEFYFTSNRLGKENNKFEVHNWDGASTYPINIYMYSKKNALKKVEKTSNMDIEYEISMTVQAYKYQKNAEPLEVGEKLELNNINNKKELENECIKVEIEKLKSTIYASNNQDDFDIKITNQSSYSFSDNDFVKLEITANAISPYTDTIKGEYYVYVGKEGLSYQIEDSENSPYLNVILTNASSEKEQLVDLEFEPNDVVLDTTSNEYITAKEYREF